MFKENYDQFRFGKEPTAQHNTGYDGLTRRDLVTPRWNVICVGRTGALRDSCQPASLFGIV